MPDYYNSVSIRQDMTGSCIHLAFCVQMIFCKKGYTIYGGDENMAHKPDSRIYSFWNGKNLAGTQDFAEMSHEDCSCCHFKCSVGDETVSAQDLM